MNFIDNCNVHLVIHLYKFPFSPLWHSMLFGSKAGILLLAVKINSFNLNELSLGLWSFPVDSNAILSTYKKKNTLVLVLNFNPSVKCHLVQLLFRNILFIKASTI